MSYAQGAKALGDSGAVQFRQRLRRIWREGAWRLALSLHSNRSTAELKNWVRYHRLIANLTFVLVMGNTAIWYMVQELDAIGRFAFVVLCSASTVLLILNGSMNRQLMRFTLIMMRRVRHSSRIANRCIAGNPSLNIQE